MSLRQITMEYSDEVLAPQLGRMMRLVDSKVGIVHSVYMQFREPDDPLLYNAASILANTKHYDIDPRIQNALQGNGGAGLTRSRCLIGAIGESLERYACSIFDSAKEIFGTYENLTREGYPCFDPERIALFSEHQYNTPEFAFPRLTRTSPISWSPCEVISEGPPIPIYYPSLLIYMPYTPVPGREEVIFTPTISTGQALGPTFEAATISGLMETIERDAYTIAWHNQLRNPILDPSTSTMVSAFIAERLASCPIQVILNYLTLDIPIPVVVATGVDRRNPNVSCTIGVAAHMDPEIAALKALIELCQDRYYVKYLARERLPVVPAEDYAHIDDFEKRVILYNDERMIPVLDFWRKEPTDIVSFQALPNLATGSDADNVRKACALLKAAGTTVIRCDCTPDDLRSVGLYAAKVIVPELQALEGNHNHRFFGCERLYQIPVEVGLLDESRKEEEMNPFPHPLP